mmetsp:Transcript_78074/g.135411  ORF Transcript_78074/g.135411 Transcript_78074/m.135411 type:complete len:313 (+) Transcript_78074:49-987(+)
MREVVLVLACLASGAQGWRMQNLIQRLERSDSLARKQLSESERRRNDDGALNPAEGLAGLLLALGKPAAFNHAGAPGSRPISQAPVQSRLAGSASMVEEQQWRQPFKGDYNPKFLGGGKRRKSWPNKAAREAILDDGMKPPEVARMPDGEAADDDSVDFVRDCVRAADERKAIDIVAFRVAHLTQSQDWLVNMIVNSRAQMGAVVSNIEDVIWETYEQRPYRQGKKDGGWVLLDFGSVVVNVFTEDTRTFYNLEGLFEDGQYLDLSDVVKPNMNTESPVVDQDLLTDDDDWKLDEDEWKLDDDDWELGENDA